MRLVRGTTVVNGRAVLCLSLALAVGGGVAQAGDPLTWGTPHPGLVEATSPDGRWAVICQAREDTDGDGEISVLTGKHGDTVGDALSPYLVVGGGSGTPIRRFLGADPTARYVVASAEGGPFLFDTVASTRSSLAKTAKAGSAEDWTADEVSFDAAGRWLLMIRHGAEWKAGSARFVVRSLADGSESSVDPGPGLLVGGDLSADGAWIVATIVPRDSDGNGVLEAPHAMTSLYDGGCRAPITSWSVAGWRGDDVVRRVLGVRGGFSRDVPGLLCLFRDRWLRRLDDGALVVEGASTPSRTVAKASERAYLVVWDEGAGECLVSPSLGPSAGVVRAVDQEGRRELDVRIDPPKEDEERRRHGRVTSIGWWSYDAYDWSKRAVVRTQGQVLASAGSRVLVSRAKVKVVLDVDSGLEKARLDADWELWEHVWQAGSFVATGGRVIDLASARVVGTYPEPKDFPYPAKDLAVMGLRDDGHLLRPSAPSAPSSHYLPPGPYRWMPPDAPK